MTPDSTTQATLEDIRNHRKKIADNPWPFPAEKMNYVIPMVEMSSILSLVEAQAKEIQELKRNAETQLKLIKILSDKLSSLSK